MPRLLQYLILSPLCLTAILAGNEFEVVSGSAKASHLPNQTIIENSSHAILQWDDFSISENHHLHFAQPNAASTVLNRVTGPNLSALMGSLTSNGGVYLINPHGVLIGPNATIQTAGFLASTAFFSNDEFLKGSPLSLTEFGEGSIINEGSITCPQGNIFLIAKNVRNSGSCSADFIGIGSGVEVMIQPNGSQRLYIRPDPIDVGEVVNVGTLEALAIEIKTASVYEKAIRIEHVDSRLTTTIEGGRIILSAEHGGLEVEGTIQAPAGDVHLLGRYVTVDGTVDVSGNNGGGTVLIGGDYQGTNPDIPQAEVTFVNKTAKIHADALQEGQGGKVILWSNKGTVFSGTISAKGGALSGDGGFVEVSSPGYLGFSGLVDTSSPHGRTGTLLLDPCAVTISAAATTGGLVCPAYSFTGLAAANILNTDLQTCLLTNNVIIDSTAGIAATGSISVTAPVTWATSSDLTLIGDQFVSVTASITSTGTGVNAGDLTITANGNTMGPTTFSGITITGVTVSCADGNLTLNGTGGNLGNNNNGILITGGATLETTGTGILTMTGVGGVGSALNAGIRINSSFVEVATGALIATGTGNGTGSDNSGIHTESSSITSTGIGVGAASLSLTGTAGNGTVLNHGVFIHNSSLVSAVDGTIFIQGTANGTGDSCSGVYVRNTSTISSTGTAPASIACGMGMSTICMVGQGSLTGTNIAIGVFFDNSSTVTSLAGNISLQGTGGGTGDRNIGVAIANTSTVTSTGAFSMMLTPANISIIGVAGNGSAQLNSGVYLGALSSAAINSFVSAIDGAIYIQGTGSGTGINNNGVFLTNQSRIESTGTAPASIACGMGMSTICMVGQGSVLGSDLCSGINVSNTSVVTSIAGNISMNGTGGGTTGSRNYGVAIANASSVTSTGAFSMMLTPANISIIGLGGLGALGQNKGIYVGGISSVLINSTVSAVDGTIYMQGTGSGGGTSDNGIHLSSTSIVRSTGTSPATMSCGMGTSTICMIGQGSVLATDLADGVNIDQSSLLTSVVGDISVHGTGGGNPALMGLTRNYGVSVQGSAFVTSTGTASMMVTPAAISIIGVGGISGLTAGSLHHGIFLSTGNITSIEGDITLNGTGGTLGSDGYGVSVASSSSITSTGTGLNAALISLTGLGGTGTSSNMGIRISSSTITSIDGPITLNGTGRGTTTSNHGILQETASVISSTGTATISFTGQGSTTGTSTNRGIMLQTASTRITSTQGQITLLGTGGGSGAGTSNDGVGMLTSSLINSIGTGGTAAPISITGMGGIAGSTNNGIFLNSGSITTVDGSMTCTGSAFGTTTANNGIRLAGAATISSTSSTGTGTITMTGTGSAAGTTGNHGILVSDAGTSINSAIATILLTGTGQGTSNTNRGISVEAGALIQGTGSANVTLNGTGGTVATNSWGVLVTGTSSTVRAATGTLTINGTAGGATAEGIQVTTGGRVTGTGAAPIILQSLNTSDISVTANAEVTTLGTLGVTSSRDLLVTGSTAASERALMQHGSGTANYAISRDVTLTGGSGAAAFANIGSTGSNGITFSSIGRNLSLTGGSGASSYAQIGSTATAASGNLLFTTIAGTTTLNGTNSNSFAVIGHGLASNAASTLSGNITLTSTGNLTIQGANTLTGTLGYAQIGHVNQTAGGSTLSGNITLQTTGTLSVLGGTANATSYARIGMGGQAGATTFGASTMQLTASRNSIFTGIAAAGSSNIINPGTGNLTILASGIGAGNYSGIAATRANINTANGALLMTGTGGNTGSNNHGILATTSTQITTLLTGALSLTGTGGNSDGVQINASTVSTVDGPQTFIGTTTGVATDNRGIAVINGATVSSTGLTGTGTITMTGTGSAVGTTGNHGILVSDSGTSINSVVATILLTGTGQGTSNTNRGISVEAAALIQGTGSANVTLNGTGGSVATNSWGVLVTGTSSTVQAATGTLTINGTAGGATAEGIQVTTGGRVTGTGAAPIILQSLNTSDISVTANAEVTTLGTLAVTSSRDLLVTGSTGASSRALMQHGSGTANYAISRDVTLTGGSGAAAFANIGSTGSNGITFSSIGRNLSLTGGSGASSYAQIGSTATTASGSVLFTTIAGTTTLNGTNSNSFAVIGHGLASNAASTLSGNITLTSTGNLTIQGANTLTGTLGYAQIGHVNQTAGGSTLSGNITLQTTGTLSVLGGTANATSYARIGMGGQAGATTFGASTIQVTASRNCVFTGIAAAGSSTIINPGTGNLTVLASGIGAGNYSGIAATRAIVNTANGILSMTGTGGNTGSNNHGILAITSTQITTLLTGALSLTGTGGNSDGVQINASTVTTVDGPLVFTGTTIGIGTDNRGIALLNGGTVTSTGLASTGTITMNGTGSAVGTTGNHGILMSDLGTNITSATSNIALTGLANGTSDNNRGISIEAGAQIISNGVGIPNLALTLVGTGDGNEPNSWGVKVTGTGTLISAIDAAIALRGASPGSSTNGVQVTSGAVVETTGIGSIGLESNPFLGQQGDISVDTGGRVTSNNMILVISSRDLLLTGGSNAGESALIQHASGDGHYQISRNAVLTGGSGMNTHARIQPTGLTAGVIFDYVLGNVSLFGGSAGVAQVGAITSNAGNITFTTVGGAIFLDGVNTNAYAAIGNGIPTTPLNLSGNININSTGDITLQGANISGGGLFGFAQIGHIDQTGGGSTLSGNITLQTQGSTSLLGGSAASTAYAQVGLGGQVPIAGPSTILMLSGIDCTLTGNTGDAIITNDQMMAGIGDITIVVDNLFPTSPFYGSGAFNFGSTITATGNLQIYTAIRSQNNVPSGSIINGQMYVPGIEFVDSATEEWNIYYPAGTYGGANFKFYYKNTQFVPPSPSPPSPVPVNPSPAVIANQGSLAELVNNFLNQEFDTPQIDQLINNILFCDYDKGHLSENVNDE